MKRTQVILLTMRKKKTMPQETIGHKRTSSQIVRNPMMRMLEDGSTIYPLIRRRIVAIYSQEDPKVKKS